MEAVRTVVSANTLIPIIDLPWKSRDMQVELIVMPLGEELRGRTSSGKSPKGFLKAYANPALLESEQHAWKNSIAEKYGTA
jgi:hypothetical protein